MATAGDGRLPCESGGAREKFRKRPFQPDICEEPQNVSQEAGKTSLTRASEINTHKGGNFASISVTVGKSELGQMLKQMTFTRSETQDLIMLLQSRIIEESPSDVVVEKDRAKLPPPSSPSSSSLKKHENGDETYNFYAAGVSSRVVEEQIGSPAELANAYKCSTIGTGQALRQDSVLFNNNATLLPKTLKSSPPQHPSTMENLPDELLSKIFIRLMARQLAQMRSVSKSWNALLSQSSFVKSHLHRSINNSDRILLAFYDKVPSSYSEPFSIHSCPRSDLEDTNFIKFPVNPQFENANVVLVIGSVNGLICYSHSDFVIHIWNPSLSALLTLPPYSMPSHGYNSLKIGFRFGFDPKTDDYKVVKLTGLTGQPKHVVRWWLQIEVYSMRKGTWEFITERFPSHITYIHDSDYVCADGHGGLLHWLGCTDTENGIMSDLERIVAFDLGSETFYEIPLPDSTRDRYCYNHSLGVLSGKLCVMSWDGDGALEVWVMDEYGVAESWAKRHVFSQFSVLEGKHGFTSHNEFLVLQDGYIVLYDLIANRMTLFFEKFCYRRRGPDKIVEYVDSLVWVGPDKNEMVNGTGQN